MFSLFLQTEERVTVVKINNRSNRLWCKYSCCCI